MPKDDNAGLFSKVVKFVKNPTTSWAELDQPELDRESGYSKQMLKEMIERKRRNDFVRKREFDMLRKLRRSEAMAGHDPGARPSFFQSSMPSRPDDRASTLKKIDEIEAQMSMQWWKTKHVGPASVSPTNSQFGSSHMPLESLRAPLRPGGQQRGPYDVTEPQPLEPVQPPKAEEPREMLPIGMLPGLGGHSPAPTVAGALPAAASVGQSEDARLTPAGRVPLSPEAAQSSLAQLSPAPTGLSPLSPFGPAADASSGFSTSKLFAIDVEEFAHDPELEEAAIRFANGDDEGAEAGLREVLGPDGARADHDETWLTLFDLYRAIGQQDRFEAAAIEFARRLGRSAPQWFSMPKLVARSAPPGASAAAAAGAQPLAQWTAPAIVGTQTLAAMTASLAKAQPPWRLNWAKLTSIETGAADALTRIFAQWSGEPVQLRFVGADVLEKVLKDATPSGDRSVDPRWWKLRMEALRLMQRPDEFELVALDYCVTYEVSPPSWERPHCEYKQLEADGSYVPGRTLIGDVFHDSLSSGMMGFGDTQEAPSTQMAQVSSIELGGQVLGDAAEMMEVLESKLQGADIIVISCARLIRIDFTAAGSLLNWVSARQAEGRQIQFVDVHRLVAAFFNVIGISEHARIIARTD